MYLFIRYISVTPPLFYNTTIVHIIYFQFLYNRVKTELTYEKLKTYPGFENTTEAVAVKQIDAKKN